MKILFYTGQFHLVEKSGVGRSILHQQKALSENGVDWTINPGEDWDIVHINTVFPGSLRLSRWARRAGKKVVYHAHSTQEDFRNSFIGSNLLAPLFKQWLRICYNSGDIILTPTPYSKKLLEGYRLKRPIITISNGIDLDYYQKSSQGRRRFREKYGLSEQQKVVISAGLQIERKGIHDFVALAKAFPDNAFLWFGQTPPALLTPPVRRILKTSLPNLLFPGYISKDELRDAYSGSDLLLFLTHEETEGIVLLEALSMEIPVLIRDIPVYEGWLADGEHLYKGKTLLEFQQKLPAILSGALPPLTAAGRRAAEARGIKVIGEQLTAIYRQVLGQQKKSCISR